MGDAETQNRRMDGEQVPFSGVEDAETRLQLNQNLYLDPHSLTPNEANDKARPAESTEQRAARVAETALSILQNGQKYPVLVVEVIDGDSVTYEYVDGGARVEAIAKLNDDPSVPDEYKVWCTLVGPGGDLFRTAVVSNLHRTQNSPLEMAYIVREARERNGWKGRGAGVKVAEYLGILPSRVSEYEKLLKAPDFVKARMESGEIGSLDVALKLMSVTEEKRAEVVERAAEIAEAENGVFNSDNDSSAGGNHDVAVGTGRQSKKPRKPKLKAKHVAKAAREVTKSIAPRTRSEIIDLFVGCTVAPYNAAVRAFATYLTKTWCSGKGTDKECVRLLDVATGTKRAKAKKVAAPKKVKASKPSAKSAPKPKAAKRKK